MQNIPQEVGDKSSKRFGICQMDRSPNKLVRGYRKMLQITRPSAHKGLHLHAYKTQKFN
jgi:hypothetical protein